MVKTEAGDTNIFNITDPMSYRCQVHLYHSRLSRLYIRVYKGQTDVPVFYLLFADVAYMDCPMTWTGADFGIAGYDECIELMLAVGLVGQAILRFPGAYASLTEHTRLYVGSTTARPIEIIAGSASMLKSIPPELI